MWVMHVEKPECCNDLGCAEESGGGCPKYRKEIFLCVEFSASGHLAKELGNMGISSPSCGTNELGKLITIL